MKHPLFESLGTEYPAYLEEHHDHILRKLDELWDTPELDDYLNDLLIDKRGGRRGFFPEATKEIESLREFRRLETFREAERKESAILELNRRATTGPAR